MQRRILKKGPRRLKKSVAQLDREMEIYMAGVPHLSEIGVKTGVNMGGAILV